MTHRDATALIDNAYLRDFIASARGGSPDIPAPDQRANPGTPAAARWADLGCGSGTFTLALAQFLPAGSSIEAIDLHPGIRRRRLIPPEAPGVDIIPCTADFVNDDLGLQGLDGILMANSLHYVRDKAALLDKLRAALRPDGALLLVEYDTDIPVPRWIPYPLSFAAATRLFASPDWRPPQKLGQRPSAFGRGNLYAALITRNSLRSA